MAQLQKGHTYNPGDVVDAADLNSLVDAATALSGLIHEQGSATPAPDDDEILFWDLSAAPPNRLRRCLISAIGSGTMTDVTAEALPTSTFGITVTTPVAGVRHIKLTLDDKSQNQFLASPADGSTGAVDMRAIVPKDFAILPVAIGALDFNWSLGNIFTKTMPATAGHTAFTFSNTLNGQTIRILLTQNATGDRDADWPVGILWRGGTEPALTQENNAKDIFTFIKIGSQFYGYSDKKFQT